MCQVNSKIDTIVIDYAKYSQNFNRKQTLHVVPKNMYKT